MNKRGYEQIQWVYVSRCKSDVRANTYAKLDLYRLNIPTSFFHLLVLGPPPHPCLCPRSQASLPLPHSAAVPAVAAAAYPSRSRSRYAATATAIAIAAVAAAAVAAAAAPSQTPPHAQTSRVSGSTAPQAPYDTPP